MSLKFQRLAVNNYRSLEHIEIQTSGMNVLFGPNGAGKSTFLDAMWFLRDCAIRGVDSAASSRSHGIGVLWDKTEPQAHISIEIETEQAIYKVMFGFSSGRIEAYVGETLTSKHNHKTLIDRLIGSDKVKFFQVGLDEFVTISLHEPEKLALNRYLDFKEEAFEAAEVDRLLHDIRYYHSRSADLFHLKTYGSAANSQIRLYDRCENLWSALRNLRMAELIAPQSRLEVD